MNPDSAQVLERLKAFMMAEVLPRHAQVHREMEANPAGHRPTLIDALKVGTAIEEIDIIDIANALTYIDNQDVIYVFDNLMKGSRNHLRAFVRNLDMQGVSYVPQYLDQASYDAIINSGSERGPNH